MSEQKPSIRVLVGVKGDEGIDKDSGKLISDTLQEIANKISRNDGKMPKVIFGVDVKATTDKITNQLNTIVQGIKIKPINLNIRTNQSSNGTFAEDERKKSSDDTKSKKRAENQKKLNDMNKQFDFLGSTEQFTKYNGILNNIDRLGLNNLIGDLRDAEKASRELEARLISLVGDKSEMSKEDFTKQISKKSSSKELQDLLEDTKKYRVELLEIERLSKKDSATFVKDSRHAKNAKDLENLITAMKKYEKANDKFKNNSELATQFNDIVQATSALKASGVMSGIDVDKLRQKFASLQGEITDMGLTGQTAFGKLRTQMEKLGVYLSASALLMGAMRQVKLMLDNVIELDNALNSLQMVTGYSNTQMRELLDTYQKLATSLSSTTSEVLAGSEVWLRQGRSISETNELIKTSTVFSKVAMIDSATASDLLTSSINGYQIKAKDAMSVVDMLSATDMKAATSSEELAVALQKTSASAKLAGVPLNELIAYIATVSETSRQSAEVVGTAMKSLFSRITQVKAGKLVDDDGDDISNVSKVLTQYGVAVQNTNGTLRDANVIISDLANTWGRLTNAEQQEVGGAVAGLKQKEQFTILMENWNRVMELSAVATDSNGYALEKFGIYQQSTAAKMAEFQNQFEILSDTIWNSDFIKLSFDTSTGLLGILTCIIENLGAIPTLVTVAAGSLSALSNKGELKTRVQMCLRPFATVGNNSQDQYENGVLCLGVA